MIGAAVTNNFKFKRGSYKLSGVIIKMLMLKGYVLYCVIFYIFGLKAVNHFTTIDYFPTNTLEHLRNFRGWIKGFETKFPG